MAYGLALRSMTASQGEFEVLDGRFPSRALGLAIEWAAEHVDELLVDWELAVSRQPLRRIEPLR